MIQNVDLIISNPAYGAIGANITYNIKDITYKEFINLLPANDYKRNSDKNLFNFQSDMIAINDGFEDAAVTTHLARIYPTEVNTMTVEEFERSNYKDKSLEKYFLITYSRVSPVFDNANLSGATDKQFKLFDENRTVLFGSRDIVNGHMTYGKDTDSYKYNVLKTLTNAELFESKKATRNGKYDGWIHMAGVTFDTAIEKTNFVNFAYSPAGFRFIAKVFTAMNLDGTITLGKVLPKVDWTRAWTVEEILADYGYTETEIAEVMADLENFKGMED
jgi:hypothetical protein